MKRVRTITVYDIQDMIASIIGSDRHLALKHETQQIQRRALLEYLSTFKTPYVEATGDHSKIDNVVDIEEFAAYYKANADAAQFWLWNS